MPTRCHTMRKYFVHHAGFFLGSEETDELENVVVGGFFDGEEGRELHIERCHHLADHRLMGVETVDVLFGNGEKRDGVRGKESEKSLHVFLCNAFLKNGVSFIVETKGACGTHHAIVFHSLEVVDELQRSSRADKDFHPIQTCLVDGLEGGFRHGVSGERNECSVYIEEKCFVHGYKVTFFLGFVKNKKYK